MKNITSIIILVAILIAVGFVFSKKKKEPTVAGEKTTKTITITPSVTQDTKTQTGVILFVGNGCPHCANIEKFIKDNGIENKVKFVKKEVWYNESNSDQMVGIAKKCGYSEDQVGVPFLWTGQKCLIGEDDVTNYFKEQAGIK